VHILLQKSLDGYFSNRSSVFGYFGQSSQNT
jgi:hypothetical protein